MPKVISYAKVAAVDQGPKENPIVGAIANSMQQGFKYDELARFAVAMGRASSRLAGTEMASLKKVYEVYETTKVYVL